MIRMISSAAVLAVFAAITGCATIVHSGPRAIPVSSTPPGAKVTIYDRDNKVVMTNTTPFVATLDPKYGYFISQSDRLVFQMPGRADTEVQLNSSLSGWYWGNLVFGGLIGMLVVDPLTGAMYNLAPEKIEQPLSPPQAQLLRDRKGVLVVLASQVTDSERAAMVPI